MKWFDRWFLRQSKKAWEMARESTDTVVKTRELHLGAPTFNLHIHKSRNGGYAIEFVRYDINTDLHHRDLYVFEDDGNLGSKITQAITEHSLRNS